MENFMEIVVSSLVGLIVGGGATTWLGLRPMNEAVTALRLHLERELGALRLDVARLEAAVSQNPAIPYERRHTPRERGA